MRKWSKVTQIFLTAFLLGAIGYVMNFVKLIQCDFEAPYKCEAMRLVGLLPPIGIILGYIDIEDKNDQK